MLQVVDRHRERPSYRGRPANQPLSASTPQHGDRRSHPELRRRVSKLAERLGSPDPGVRALAAKRLARLIAEHGTTMAELLAVSPPRPEPVQPDVAAALADLGEPRHAELVASWLIAERGEDAFGPEDLVVLRRALTGRAILSPGEAGRLRRLVGT